MYATKAHHRRGDTLDVSVRQAKEAVRRTLELDPRNAMAHASLGAVLYSCEWNWPEAEREFRLAISLNPADAASHNAYAIGLMLHGRFHEALDQIDQAMALDPIGYRMMDDRAEILFMARRYEEAIRESETVLQATDYSLARLVLGISQAAAGRLEQGIVTLEDLLRKERLPEFLGRYGAVLAAAGRRKQATEVLSELLADTRTVSQSGVYIAYVYSALGDRRNALDWLKKAVDHRSADALRLEVDPAFDGLRSEPQYAALKQRLGL